MIRRFKLQRLMLAMAATGVFCASNTAFASAFQLWEQDGASIGNYHAGYAASADSASTAFFNPAGLVRIHNQQMVLAVDPVLTDFRFNGTVNVNTLTANPNQPTVAQGGSPSFVPSLNYAAPIGDRVVFGFSAVSPFGLKTDYGRNSFARYAATRTQLTIIDLSPSLAVAVTDKFSVGAGLDFENARAEFDLVAGLGLVPGAFDTTAENVGRSNSTGFHLGAMYQFSDATRVGISYHSKVVHHLHGTSKFQGNLANFDGFDSLFEPVFGFQESQNLRAKLVLPATTALSVFHSFNQKWDIMGSVIYTEWNVLKTLTLQNVSGIMGGVASNGIAVNVVENYRNTWNVSTGVNYHFSDSFLITGGIGYDESPSNDRYRNLQLPDSDRAVLALGTHLQATKTLGFDLGWSHYFVMNTRINNQVQAVGDQVTTVNGRVNASADVYGLQVKWDIA